MVQRRHKRKNAYARTHELKLRFYKGAAIATSIYVVLSLIKFHGQYTYLPYELAVTWAVFLFCYATFKEVLRWNDGSEEETYYGELWMMILLSGAAWILVWNLVRVWVFSLPSIPFPEDYEAATLETIILYTLSVISSFLYKYNKAVGRHPRRRPRARTSRADKNQVPLPVVAMAKAETSAPQPPNQNMEVVLTNAKLLEKDSPQK